MGSAVKRKTNVRITGRKHENGSFLHYTSHNHLFSYLMDLHTTTQQEHLAASRL
jgi:hypothetical protein